MVGPAHHHRHAERFFVHKSLVEPAVFAEIEALVGGVDDDGVFVESCALEVVEDFANAFVDACHAAHIVLEVALVFPFGYFFE